MSAKQHNLDVSQLIDELKRGLPDAPGSLSQQEFDSFCDNVASAIVKAIDMYDSRMKSPEPDYGEEERVV
jgi:hypothetical protein